MNRIENSAEEMTVAQLLAQVCRMSGHHLRAQMEKIGLHRGQGFALIHLLHSSGMPQRDLARSMHISPASVTNMLQRMERDGWIERKRDAVDQRIVRVVASEKGKRLRRETRRVFQEMEDELGSIYTQEEQSALKHLLIKLYEHYAPGDPHPFHLRRLFEEQEDIDPCGGTSADPGTGTDAQETLLRANVGIDDEGGGGCIL